MLVANKYLQRLRHRLPLPPEIELNDARVRLIKITLPGDLYTSSLTIEVSGVEVQVTILEPKKDRQTGQPRSSQFQRTSADRPRQNSPTSHDPGGLAQSKIFGGPDALLPTSEGIAQSFLQAEPDEELQELESAVAAQSQQLQGSMSYGSDSASGDLGIGAATTLPTFLTDMVKGFFDRLQVRITEINVRVSFELARSNVGTSIASKETAQFLLQVTNVCLHSVDSSLDPESPQYGERKVSLDSIRLCLLGEPEGSFRTSSASTLSSPEMRSRASGFGTQTFSDARSEASSAYNSPNISRVPSWAPTQTPHSPKPEKVPNNLDESRILQPDDVDQLSTFGDEDDNIASILAQRGKLRREKGLSSSSMLGSFMEHKAHEKPDEMSESKLYSHDDAESMYMSAVSGPGLGVDMPGAWSVYAPPAAEPAASKAHTDNHPTGPLVGSTDNLLASIRDTTTEDGAEDQAVSAEPSSTDLPASKQSDKGAYHRRQASNSSNGGFVPPILGSPVARELVVLEQLECILPPFFGKANSIIENTTAPAPSNPVPPTTSIRFAQPSRDAGLDASFTSTAGSIYGHGPQPAIGLEDDADFKGIRLSITTIRIDFDISVAKLLLAISQTMLARSGQNVESVQPEDTITNPPLRAAISHIEVNILEQVHGFMLSKDLQSLPFPLGKSPDMKRDILLAISMDRLNLSNISKVNHNETHLHVGHFSISHGNGDLLTLGRQSSSSTTGPIAITPPCISTVVVSTDMTTHVDVRTQPVGIIIDLRAIEDVISRAGGLSNLLDLGGSISSLSTIKGVSARPITPKHTRGVRFQQDPPPQKERKGKSNKIHIRIEASSLQLVGSESAVHVTTSPIKLVQRPEVIGLQIDKIHLIGPLRSQSDSDNPIDLSISNTRIEYLDVPKEADIDRLLRLITPSKERYDDDDDIMLDTLLRQRSKGAVLRLTIGSINVRVDHLEKLNRFSALSADLARLSGVTKYLPEDDRPGMLILLLVKETTVGAVVNQTIGQVDVRSQSLEAAYITMPSLTAAQVSTMSVWRNEEEELIVPAVEGRQQELPMLMGRFVAGEMEPTIKLKLFNILLEYRVPTLVALLGLGDEVTQEDLAIGFAASLADLRQNDSRYRYGASSLSSSPGGSHPTEPFLKDIKVDIGMRDFIIGLTPTSGMSKGLVCLTNANVVVQTPSKTAAAIDFSLKKASVLLVDNPSNLEDTMTLDNNARQPIMDAITSFKDAGFVSVADLSSASVKVRTQYSAEMELNTLDVELRDDLFILETCADSTQTLIELLNGLQPPAPVSKIAKYRTEIVPLNDMLASFSGDAFVSESGPDEGLRAVSASQSEILDDTDQELEYVSEFYAERPLEESRGSLSQSSAYLRDMPSLDESRDLEESQDLEESVNFDISPRSSEPSPEEMVASALHFQDDYFARNSVVGGTAHNWTKDNSYGQARERKYQDFPVRVKVRDIHFIWNLYDGYDWQKTRDTISQAVKDIEVKAASKRGRQSSGLSPDAEEDEASVIGDFLFNSIYIGIPAHRDPHDLAANINRGINDDVSETGSYATSVTMTSSPSRKSTSTRTRSKRLKLSRSRHHKMTFELGGVSADVLVFPPGTGETQSSVDVRVKDLVIFDHVPTSTWRRFATYMQDAGERESGTSMVHLEILNVKPVPDLAATEMILKVTILPLRLHVDQDALDFLTRFFEFKDDSAPPQTSPSNPPFIQRAEVNPVRIRLDFKPKRVDYGGLRSGRTTEFMNFFILDQADMVLRRVILYGVSGFDRLGLMLNSIWTPDVRSNQLPGVLAGLAPIRSIVNVGSGVKDLVVLPVREYRKDGRIVRSIQKGAMAFAKTTTSELVKLGAKLALGTQTVLQNTETLLSQAPESSSRGGASDKWADDSADEDEPAKKQISLYADQPIGVVQGLRGAYASLERDLLLARDAIVAVPGEAMESGSAKGAAKAVLRNAPTVILRPAMGVTKAVGQTLLGAGNTLDRENYRRAEEVRIFLVFFRPRRRNNQPCTNVETPHRNTNRTNRILTPLLITSSTARQASRMHDVQTFFAFSILAFWEFFFSFCQAFPPASSNSKRSKYSPYIPRRHSRFVFGEAHT